MDFSVFSMPLFFCWYRSTYKGSGDEKMKISETRMFWRVASILWADFCWGLQDFPQCQMCMDDLNLILAGWCIFLMPLHQKIPKIPPQKKGWSFRGLVVQSPKERSRSHVLGVSWMKFLAGFSEPVKIAIFEVR